MQSQPAPRQDQLTATSAVTPDRPPDDAPAASPVDAPSPRRVESDQPGELNPRQLRLLSALVTSTDLQAACKCAEVSRAAAYQWLKQPAFHDELQRQRSAILSEALANVKINATRAAAELVGLLDEDDPGLRRLVCRDILDRASRIYDMENIETRMASMEKTLKQQSGARS